MKKKALSTLSDEELLREAKKMKSHAITNAVFIGALIGIFIYSLVKSSLGLFTLIPLFFAYKFIQKSRYDNHQLEQLLKERNLK
ncbi:MAG: hypothetical protein QM802_18460 [Agriterribacter sp.]